MDFVNSAGLLSKQMTIILAVNTMNIIQFVISVYKYENVESSCFSPLLYSEEEVETLKWEEETCRRLWSVYTKIPQAQPIL